MTSTISKKTMQNISDEKKNEIFLLKLDNVINRLENNHHSWYLIQVTILLAYLPLTLSIAGSLSASVIITTIFLTVYFLSIYNSRKYLVMGRCYRGIEKKFLIGEWDAYNFDHKKYKSENKVDVSKVHFTEITSMILFTVVILLSVFMIIVCINKDPIEVSNILNNQIRILKN